MHGRRSVVNVALWVLQILLGLFMALASGVPKLLLPAESLPMPIPIPGPLLIFIGVAEILGGLGLILPGLLKIRPGLTPLAAAGLALIAIGGTVYQLMAGEPGNAAFAVAIALLCAFVAYGRWQLVPHRGRTEPRTLQSVG
jgi:DoxX-like family